jgi:hypothetical protein
VAGLAFINCVGLVSEFGWQPGALAVTVAALPVIVIAFRCMTGFTVVQTNMEKIVFQPTFCVGVTGVAGTNIVFCRAGMAVFAVSVSGMVEFIYLPILEVDMAILAGTAGVVILRFFGFVTG